MTAPRIRSEIGPALWPQAFVPGPAAAAVPGEDDVTALLPAATRALAALFGRAVTVLPGRAEDSDAPAVAPALAGLLLTLRLGGDAARAGGDAAAGNAGAALARYARAIAAALCDVAVAAWPPGCRAPELVLQVTCGPVAGLVRVPAPPLPAPEPASAVAPATGLYDLAMRVRVEIASDLAPVAGLLPLAAGIVLPISPVAEMPLIIGDHRIGRATVAALPDGRQAATIVAMAVAPLGGRR